MNRRHPALLLVLAALVTIVVTARDRIEADGARFTVSASGWMSAAPIASGLTETWFCPGVPASGEDGIGGEVVVANRNPSPLVGTLLLISDQGPTSTQPLAVEPFTTQRLDVDATLQGGVVAAVVEVEGGGAVVEQKALHPSGNSIAPCANATSDTWYLADGFTVDGSLDQIVLTNPFEQTVVANVGFATEEGSRAPAAYQGLTVPARSVRVLDLGAPGAGAQGEPVLAVKVESSRGRLVVGRSQRFLGGGRLGHQVTLASPVLRDQWWFADGAKGPGVSERFSIYNPTEDAVEVDPIFVGIPNPVVVDPIEVPARQVVTFDPGSVADLPEGRHAVVFSTQAEPSVVVERAVTRTVGESVGTSVIAGATPRQDGYVASTWHLAAGPTEPTEEALIVYNADNTPGTLTVSAVGPSGLVPVPGLEDIELPAAAIVTLDLLDEMALDRQLVVVSTSRVFVERSFDTGRGGTRNSSWALPES